MQQIKDGLWRNVDNIWNDIYCLVKTDTYATQKPEELLERIILASSNKGDLVADFFCGSGTTCVVAKELGRNYLGCDIGEKAILITNQRLNGEL